MTITWEAVTAISLIRWLDTNTVRPWPASDCMSVRTHRMPSGSRPLTGSSNIRTPGSPSKRAGNTEALRHPEGEGPRFPPGDIAQPDEVEHLVDPLRGMWPAWASASRWFRAFRPGW